MAQMVWNKNTDIRTWNKSYVNIKDEEWFNCECKICQKKFHLKKYAVSRGRGVTCSKKCYYSHRSNLMKDKSFNPSYRVDFSGENNPNWRGGISQKEYPWNFNVKLKERIRKRDNFTCQLCGCPEKESKRKLDIHHIDYNKENLSETNLVTLCRSCNSKVNWGRKEWELYFQKEVLPNVLT